MSQREGDDEPMSGIERVDERRRALVRVVLGAPVVIAAASSCSGGTPGKRSANDFPDTDAHARWRVVRAEQLLLSMHQAAVKKHPDLAGLIEPLSAHHEDHLAAVLADGPLPIGADGVAKPEAPRLPSSADAALDAIRAAEREASSVQIAAAEQVVGPALAALIGSIAASEASHDVVLA